MKVTAIKIRNFRTLEEVDLEFPSAYTAICGPNDSGKTNVVRAIRALVKDEDPYRFVRFGREDELSLKDDFPKWKETPSADRRIELSVNFQVARDSDAGFYQFLAKHLSLEDPVEILELGIEVVHGSERSESEVNVECSGNTYSGFEAQEVLKKLQTSGSILFHNSTQPDPRFVYATRSGVIRAETPEHEALIERMQKTVNRGLNKISKAHQQQIEELLGRLETKYRVGLSMPAFDFSSVPFGVTLGQKKFEVPLDDWGSGTKNRTLILMILMRAKQLSESEASAGKVTPIIVIEEPESFLHPAAQAEFGRVLQDLAEEFQVQVIVTTHSPYLLSIDNPASNILLERVRKSNQLQETRRIETSGDNWMQPFCQALGLESEEFKPWKTLLLTASASILLVEGDTDKEYFEMLRDDAHGEHRLVFDGDIVPYDGTGSLRNTVLLRFIKNRHDKLFVTFDLDAEQAVTKSLKSLGLERRRHFLPIGIDAAGKRAIEGLLPSGIMTAVYGENADLVQAATHGTKDEQQSAKNNLKKLILEKFKNEAQPGQEYFGAFYPVVKAINKALC